MLKKISLVVLNFFSILCIVVSVLVLLTVIFTGKGKAPKVMGYTLFRVMTGSMEPAIPVNSLIIVKEISPEQLQEGDVISFYSRDPSLMGQVNTHRIVSIEQMNGEYHFHTKGDANNVDDKYETLQGDLVGKVIYSSYRLGQVVRLISNPLIFVPMIILPLIIILGHSVWESVTIAKKIAKEEEEQAVREAVEAIKQRKKEAAKLPTDTEEKEETSE